MRDVDGGDLEALEGETTHGERPVVIPTLPWLDGTEAEDATMSLAEQAGVEGFLAVERFAVPEPALYDLEDVAGATGLPPAQVALLWRSLGLPLTKPGARVFTDSDAEMISTVADLIKKGMVAPDLALQMSRVIGWSLARVATAMVDSFEADADPGQVVANRAEEPEVATVAATMLPTMTQVIEQVWRRHLQIAARRRIIRELDTGQGRDVKAVGFADLVGFTTLSQQVDQHTLAGIIGRFEDIAYDTVTGAGGRVVKMIGDEVMYMFDEPAKAVRVGLDLADEYAADEALSDVRVGIACGPVLEREADIYGPVVNLASRIVNIAFPGSVVTTDKTRTAVGDDPELAWKLLKPRRIKDIGLVPLWSVWRADDDSRVGPRAEVRERRTKAREQFLATLADNRDRNDGLPQD